jgi:coenzyme PQQ biosynthesis protein PqqD
MNGERRVAIARGARLRFDRVEGRHVLLSPERGLALSDTATAVARLCDGTRSAAQIADQCASLYAGADRARVGADVDKLLAELFARGLVVYVES